VNRIRRNFTVSPTYEEIGQINFLDFLLLRKDFKIDTDIHHEPYTVNPLAPIQLLVSSQTTPQRKKWLHRDII
jgi:hypothetical protein